MITPIQRSDFDTFMVPNYAPAAFVPVKGEGATVWDQTGKDYIDFGAGIAVNALGHCHPAMVKALAEQSQKLWHVSNLLTNEPALKLARTLVENTFAERVFFCNSGAEANEAAYKLARRYAHDQFGAHKDEILSFGNSFHGRTFFTVSVGGQPKYSDGFGPRPAGIRHLPYNDIAALEAAVSDKTCAIVVEPIQGEGGVIPADPAFLAAARRLADQHNALLVFDEVQTGVGRCGALYAYQTYDVVPDILTSAKGLGGGFPIGAMLTTSAIAASFSVGVHGTTYGGNPLACAVSQAVLEIVKTPAVLEGVMTRHTLFKTRLEALGQQYGQFKTVRGKGLLLGAVLEGAWEGRAGEIVQAAAGHGLLVLMAGVNVVRFAPPLVISDAECEAGFERFEAVLAGLSV